MKLVVIWCQYSNKRIILIQVIYGQYYADILAIVHSYIETFLLLLLLVVLFFFLSHEKDQGVAILLSSAWWHYICDHGHVVWSKRPSVLLLVIQDGVSSMVIWSLAMATFITWTCHDTCPIEEAILYDDEKYPIQVHSHRQDAYPEDPWHVCIHGDIDYLVSS